MYVYVILLHIAFVNYHVVDSDVIRMFPTGTDYAGSIPFSLISDSWISRFASSYSSEYCKLRRLHATRRAVEARDYEIS